MGRVHVVGRRRSADRCAICHGALDELATECGVCAATMHDDCRRDLARCPTLGCDGEAPRSGGGPRVRATSAHRAPGGWARFGPYSRLLTSAVLWALIGAASAGVMAWPVLDASGYWRVVSSAKGGGHSLVNGVVVTLVLAVFSIALLIAAVDWLRRVPAVFREVRQLLDSSRPVPMRLTPYSVSSGKTTSWYVRLESRDQPTLELSIEGILPAAWLRKLRPGTPVLVYGLPPPGPYLIEVDGWLALVHPD